MYPIDDETLELFKDAAPQKARITMDSTVFTEEDIVQGGLSVNRYCASGNMIEIGSAIAAEASVIIDNYDGRFDALSFGGKELFIEIGVENEEEEIVYVPLGYFTIDTAPRKLSKITIAALDRMMLFEKPINPDLFIFPRNVGTLFEDVCSICNVTLATDTSGLVNSTYRVVSLPSTIKTYRDLLSRLCEITASCAFINYDGELEIGWYTETDTTITAADRYTSDIYESPVTITGVQVLAKDKIYAAGTDGYVITIQDNPLIQDKWQDIADNVYAAIGGFSYTPFTASVLSMPHIYPLDIITFTDKNGVDVFVAVTDWTFRINGRTELKGRGQTDTVVGYGKNYQYTRDEAALVDQVSTMDREQMGFYEIRNTTEVVIDENERHLVSFLRLASNANSYAQIHIEVNLEAVDTDSNNITLAICSYQIDNDEITNLYPTETYIDGKHVLHLMYVLALRRNVVRSFSLFMRAESGNIYIAPYGVWSYVSGVGLAGNDKWTGFIDIFEDSVEFNIPDTILVEDATETLTIRKYIPVGGTFSDTTVKLTIGGDPVCDGTVTDRVRIINHGGAMDRVLEDMETNRVTEDGDYRLTEEEAT